MDWPSSSMGWPSSRMGWSYNYIGRILLMLATSSRVDAQAYQKHAVLDIVDMLTVFVWKKLESWWVAHWLPSQITVPLVVTNVSQLHETIMWVCSVRLISYQWYNRFLLFNMSRGWRKSAHCQGTTNGCNTIQHEIHISDHAPVLCARLKWKLSRNRLPSVLINPSNSLWSATVVLIMKNGEILLLQILNISNSISLRKHATLCFWVNYVFPK